MEIQEIKNNWSKSCANYSYWLDYTTPLGKVCDTNINVAHDEMKAAYRDMVEAGLLPNRK